MKLPRVAPKLFAGWLALCAVGGAVVTWLSGMPFWAGVVIVAVALILNSAVAEVEDHAPGGFNNPKRKLK
jgi:hypothetical protein